MNTSPALCTVALRNSEQYVIHRSYLFFSKSSTCLCHVTGHVKLGQLDDYPFDPVAHDFPLWLNLVDSIKVPSLSNVCLVFVPPNYFRQHSLSVSPSFLNSLLKTTTKVATFDFPSPFSFWVQKRWKKFKSEFYRQNTVFCLPNSIGGYSSFASAQCVSFSYFIVHEDLQLKLMVHVFSFLFVRTHFTLGIHVKLTNSQWTFCFIRRMTGEGVCGYHSYGWVHSPRGDHNF